MCNSKECNSRLASHSSFRARHKSIGQFQWPFASSGSTEAARDSRPFQLAACAAAFILLAETFLPLESARAANPQPPSANTPSLVALSADNSTRNSDVLARKILLDEIALEKFNLNYRLQTGKVDRWKGTRYFLLQEDNVVMLDAGFIATVAERSAHLGSPQNVNILTLEKALIPRIIARSWLCRLQCWSWVLTAVAITS